jgi:hypothetical protein
MATQLKPNGAPVNLGRIVLRTPGLTGAAELRADGIAGLRGEEAMPEWFAASLADADVQAQAVVEIAAAREVGGGGAPTRSTSYGDPAIVLEAPAPGEGFGQMVLATDENGVATWSFAEEETAGEALRGGTTRTYVIPRKVPPVAGPGETRGVLGFAAKKLLQVLVFPLVTPAFGAVGDFFVSRWEGQKRPYGLRTFSAANHALAAREQPAWNDLALGRALLFVHGTFSQSHTGFGKLPAPFLQRLCELYGGRVFAFDHPSVSVDPRENAEWLLAQLPGPLEVDIICHSRGGLVSRVLSEKQGEILGGQGRLKVRKIVFVATPNAGTILADADHLGDLLDTYTNLLLFFPDGGLSDILDVAIAVAKQVAVGALKGLDGLQCMLPDGPFLKGWLNSGPRVDTRYYALAADFEPTGGSLRTLARDRLFDRVFKAENDLVVPTKGVFEANGSGCFPIEEREVFPSGAGVHHSGFWANERACERVFGWLSA